MVGELSNMRKFWWVSVSGSASVSDDDVADGDDDNYGDYSDYND